MRRTFVVLGIVLDGHSNLDRFSDEPLPEKLGLAFGRTAAQGSGTALGSAGGGMAAGAVGGAFCGPGAPVCFGAFVIGGTIIGGVAGHETGTYFFDLATGGAG